MYLVQFFSSHAQKQVLISKHRHLDKAIKAARKAYSEDGYNNVTISYNSEMLDIYGKKIAD